MEKCFYKKDSNLISRGKEGFERKGNKEFARFLFIGKGSSGEVRSMLILAKGLNIISEKDFKLLFAQAEEISKMLSGFIKKLST